MTIALTELRKQGLMLERMLLKYVILFHFLLQLQLGKRYLVGLRKK